MAKKKAAKPKVPVRPAVTHGGKRVELPLLSGPVGEPHPDLASKYPRMNAQLDVEIVEYYLNLLSQVHFFASATGGRDPGPRLKQVCEVVQTWDAHLPAAIRAFQQRVGMGDLEETKYGIIRPDGPTLTELVDLDGAAAPADKKKKPALGSDASAAATKADDDGDEHAYYGRGYAQLTWWSNYARVGAQIGRKLDLLFDPDLALDPVTSYSVLSYSVRTGKGFANGHRLAHYFYGDKTDYVGARAMVNGKDHAGEIAKYAQKFEAILLKARKLP